MSAKAAPQVDARGAAALFAEMAELLVIRGGDPYRARSFRRAAKILDKLDEPLLDALRFGALARRRGIGSGILDRLAEMLRGGSCKDLDVLRGDLPSGLRELLAVDGIGPKTVRLLWTHLRIGSIEELEAAARGGRLSALPRFGERAAERIISALEGYRKKTHRTPLAEALRLAGELADALEELPSVQRVAIAGSARRRKATVGDLDLLVASYEPLAVSSQFITLPTIDSVLSRGESKTSVRLDSGQQVDLRVLVPETFGAGLCYFTGSQQHNIMLRVRGNKRRLKISEHGVFTRVGEQRLAGALEEEVFAAVGLPFIPPELRENAGELEAAAEGRLPALATSESILGDLHVRSDPGDREGSVEALAREALWRGLTYLVIADPSPSRVGAGGLDVDGLKRQGDFLRDLEQRLGAIRLLHGVEVEILPDGSLDHDPAILTNLDWVLGGMHIALDQPPERLMGRLLTALESGLVDCLAHPLGRTIGASGPAARPEGLSLDVELMLHRARRHGVALEVHGSPGRLDLPAERCRQARRARVPLALGSGTSSPQELSQLDLALSMARRGWVEASQLLNARPPALLAEQRQERLRRPSTSVAVGEVLEEAEVELGEDLPALAQALGQEPLPEPLRERLEAWLHGETDEALAAALELRGDNPTRQAFALLWRGSTEVEGKG